MSPILEEIVKAKKKKVSKMTEGKFNLPKPKKIERTGDEGSIAPRKKLEPKIIRRNKMPDKIGEDEPAQAKGISKKELETISEPETETEKPAPNEDLEGLNKPQLITLAKQMKIKNISTMNKAQLKTAIQDSIESGRPPKGEEKGEFRFPKRLRTPLKSTPKKSVIKDLDKFML
jgi:hypothetical protein